MGRRAGLPVLLALLLAACSSATDTALPTTTTAADAATTTTTVAAEVAARADAYSVGSRTLTLVDPDRPTDADGGRDRPAQPDRTISVLLLYPAEGDAGTTTEVAPDRPPAPGRFPLVVFSHGWTAEGPRYEGRLKEWARAGYVVAAPTYPLSSGAGGVLADYVNQPADVSFVIDELLALGADDPLAGAIDGDAIAAAGHSLGAITTLGVTLNSCCADPRIGAAVQISGVRLPFPGGAFDDLGRVPFLAIHGAQDGVVPVSGSDTLFEEAEGPAHYLRFPDGDHSGFLVSDGPLIDAVVIAFLDRHLLDEPEGLDEVAATVAASGRAVLTEKPDP
jgi:predicted dienelactone hydrolase